MAFVKLDCGMIDSTIWIDHDARDVFITALLMAVPYEIREPAKQIKVREIEFTGFEVPPGWYGFVAAAGTGIIHRCGIAREAGLSALERLGEPESESRTPDFEGRRMVRIDGGYLILNYDQYRKKDHTSAERAKRYRERKASRVTRDESRVTSRSVTQAEAEAEADPSLKGGGSGTGKPVPPPAAKKESKSGTAGQKISAVWNSFPNLIKIQNVGSSRLKHLQARAKDPFFVQNWEEGIKRVAESDFCTGKNERAWVATFDWFIRPDSLVRIMEGKYANRNGTGKPQTEGERDQKNTGFAPIKPKILE